MPLDAAAHSALRSLVVDHPERSGFHDKWSLYRRATEIVGGQVDCVEKMCWDYFDDDTRALSDHDMWVKGMTTEEGARTEPSGEADPYRGSPRYMTVTISFLVVFGSPSDIALAELCNIPQADLWKRATLRRILNGLGAVSFASVKSDVLYVIPGDTGWGLTLDDLAQSKFDYLRPVV